MRGAVWLGGCGAGAAGPWPGSVRGLEHGLAERQVPVVLGAVLLEVLPRHVLRGALLELHLAKAAILRRALQRDKG